MLKEWSTRKLSIEAFKASFCFLLKAHSINLQNLWWSLRSLWSHTTRSRKFTKFPLNNLQQLSLLNSLQHESISTSKFQHQKTLFPRIPKQTIPRKHLDKQLSLLHLKRISMKPSGKFQSISQRDFSLPEHFLFCCLHLNSLTRRYIGHRIWKMRKFYL
jgi:hypothetical protein